MVDFTRERALAIEAGRAASVLCQRVQHNMVTEDSLQKKDRSPVTVADFGAQAIVARLLQRDFPDDPLVGEENADALRQDDQEAIRQRVVAEVSTDVPGVTEEQVLGWIDRGIDEGGRHRFWTLDPIDGTKGFLRGEQYAVALALVIDGTVQVGVLACPNLWSQDEGGTQGQLYVAVRGQGCMRLSLDGTGDEVPVRASTSTDAGAARVVESVEAAHGNHDAHDAIKEHLGVGGESVRLDSQAKYAVLARGESELYLRMPTRKDYREAIWDQAAGSIVIEEAGGRVSDVDGKPLDFTTGRRLLNNSGVLASNGVMHDRLLESVQATWKPA